MSQRFYIQDYGLCNAMGEDKASIAHNWSNNTSPGMLRSDAYYEQHPTMLGTVTATLPEIPETLTEYKSRNNQLLLQALEQIKDNVELLRQQYGNDRIAIVLGTSTSGVVQAEKALKTFFADNVIPEDYHFKQQDMRSGADFLQQYLDLSGPVLTISTACSSSGNAFTTARRLMRGGFCDAAIVGGADSLCQTTVQGFNALKSVSPDTCQPFSQNRKGINIGEASALFIISQEPADIELYAVGCSSDAHHISAPEPTGKGAIAAMQHALSQTALDLQRIDYINLHGTATLLNDAMESSAIHSLFGEATLCSSTKSLTGHTLGAASATELGLCTLLLDKNINLNTVPAQSWDRQYDPELKPINISSNSNSQHDVRVCMSNSFAFGGNNTSLIIGHPYETL